MKTLYVRNAGEWRSWLEKHGQSAKEIFVIYYKKASGKPRIPYEDAVEQALCFGWIDGRTNKLDADRFVQRFTPRQPNSRWSEINIRRTRKLIREGRMTPAGLAVFRPERKVEPKPNALPPDLLKEFQKSGRAWRNFLGFPPYYQRMTSGWIASAKKPETQRKRFRQLLEFSAANKRIQFM